MKKIIIIGSTGTLGTKLLNYCSKNNIKIDTITGYKNQSKLNYQSKKFNCNFFLLSDTNQKNNFCKYLSKANFDLVYFLDFGSSSLFYFKYLLKKNYKSTFAVANKELIIAGGIFLMKLIDQYKCSFIPLDSEHFSLIKSNITNHPIKKVYITASGGPFYFKQKINLNNVSLKEVLNHPKWRMGINNSIDSSNFVNKFLEMFELSSIYNIDLNNIDFLISKNAFVHSVVCFKDSTFMLNCFNNNMLISLIYPLNTLFKLKPLKNIYKLIISIYKNLMIKDLKSTKKFIF